MKAVSEQKLINFLEKIPTSTDQKILFVIHISDARISIYTSCPWVHFALIKENKIRAYAIIT
jgi:hypothetical protein